MVSEGRVYRLGIRIASALFGLFAVVVPLSGTASATSDTLGSGQKLLVGQYLRSSNGLYELDMQGDGNLVLYARDTWHRALWATRTTGTGNYAFMDSAVDGTGFFEVRSSSGAIKWLTPREGGHVTLFGTGDLQLLNGTTIEWYTGTASTSILAPNQKLTAGHYLISADHHYELIMQTDGNLVLYRLTDYKPGATTPSPYPIWYTGTTGTGNFLVMQLDGNLVEYTSTHVPLWNVGISSSSYAGAYLHLQYGDGNLVLWRKVLAVLWATSGMPPAVANVFGPAGPSWWRGMCDTNRPSGGHTQEYVPTSPSHFFDGLIACSPGYPLEAEQSPFNIPDAFQCVELSERWIYQRWGSTGGRTWWGANGSQVVDAYASHLSGKPLQVVRPPGSTESGTPAYPGSLGPGDVVSYGSTSTDGHTDVVERVLLDASGTGHIWTLNQNWGVYPGHATEFELSVNHWKFSAGSAGSATGWLHYTG